ncbi:MAG: acyl-CoA dehydrogenase family protein, partial [Acidobacteriota bacterium]|nr:acyl-CoA dehydrogenase family protein [Acidobacteriota bacterium]
MDFNDTPEQAAYRDEVRAWLSANAEPRKDRPSVSRRLDAEEGLLLAKRWQAKKADAGYACRHWPVAHGGQGRPMIETIIYDQEEANFDVPTGFFSIGLGMCGPVMAQYAT